MSKDEGLHMVSTLYEAHIVQFCGLESDLVSTFVPRMKFSVASPAPDASCASKVAFERNIESDNTGEGTQYPSAFSTLPMRKGSFSWYHVDFFNPQCNTGGIAIV